MTRCNQTSEKKAFRASIAHASWMAALASAAIVGCGSSGSSGSSGGGGGAGGGASTPPALTGPSVELAATIGTRPNEYGGTAYVAEQMLDESAQTYWCSSSGVTLPVTFTLDLPVEAEITGLRFDSRVSGYDTSGPKDVVIDVATASAPAAFSPALTTALPMNAETNVALPRPMRAKVVRVSIRTVHGGTYAVLASLRLLGRGGTPRAAAVAAAGSGAGATAGAAPAGPTIVALDAMPEARGYMQLVRSVGMDSAFTRCSGMSFLVPNEAAIAAMPAAVRSDRAALRNALASMLLMGFLSRDNAPGNPTWSGLDQARTSRTVAVTGPTMTVDGATVVRSDVAVGECTAHVIDRFLVPATFDRTVGRNPFGVNVWQLPN